MRTVRQLSGKKCQTTVTQISVTNDYFVTAVRHRSNMFDNQNHLFATLRLSDLVIDAIKVELICDF